MNLILLQPDDAWSSADQVRLVGRRADHIRQQLKAVVGQSVRVGRGQQLFQRSHLDQLNRRALG